MTKLGLAVLLGVWVQGCAADSDTTAGGDSGLRYAGGETSDFGSGSAPFCEYETGEAITATEAVAVGLDPETAIAAIEGKKTASLGWFDCSASGKECVDTEITLNVTIESLYRAALYLDRTEDSSCPAQRLEVRALVDFATADKMLSGSLHTLLIQQNSDPAAPRYLGYPWSDLRNFNGSLPLPLDINRPHWTILEASLVFGSVFAGTFRLSGQYDDNSYTIRGNLADFGASYNDIPRETLYGFASELTTWVELANYEGSKEAPTGPVEVCLAGAARAKPVEVAVSIDGKRSASKQLGVGECIDLGDQPLDAVIVATATNTEEDSLLDITIKGDYYGLASESCKGPSCVVKVETTVYFKPSVT